MAEHGGLFAQRASGGKGARSGSLLEVVGSRSVRECFAAVTSQMKNGPPTGRRRAGFFRSGLGGSKEEFGAPPAAGELQRTDVTVIVETALVVVRVTPSMVFPVLLTPQLRTVAGFASLQALGTRWRDFRNGSLRILWADH